MDCEVLFPEKIAQRGLRMLRAMIDAAPAAGVSCMVTQHYRAQAPVLMSYGLGHPERRLATDAHVRSGGRLIGWDMGYWQRDNRDAMRLTIDEDHPHRWIQPMAPERWERAGIELREDSNPAGPIVLCGLGKKSRRMLRESVMAWETMTLERLRRQFPGREIVWRPKRTEPGLQGCRTGVGPIEDVIRGSSLVVCRHSNVAVDACIAGVPVQCEDGAALALYRDNPAPSREQRLGFLRSLAWWQWSPSEAVEAWQFIKARVCA